MKTHANIDITSTHAYPPNVTQSQRVHILQSTGINHQEIHSSSKPSPTAPSKNEILKVLFDNCAIRFMQVREVS